MCSYEIIAHTSEAVRSHHKDSRNERKEIVEQLDSLKTDQFQQNNLLGNIVVTEAGNIQQMLGVVASRSYGMSESKIKELVETAMEKTLEKFLASSDKIDFRTQDGQS